MRDEDNRPNPDALLEMARREEDHKRRGRLRIFLGMAPGVGKTYAMLEAAGQKRAEGLDVVCGVVETHGRKETETLLEPLTVLPRRRLDYKGREVLEFDLDATLARRPGLVLVDELAHHNAPGSRHPKRWRDVEELLDHGLDVWTTLNVQHLESLNDVVAQITGVRVRETVPDAVLERAESVILVDLPPEDLLQRLQDGKVYLPRQAEWAAENFFRSGNLSALRELALRCTANRVNTEVLIYRKGHAITTTWPTAERILVCVGPSPSSATLVRAAKRLADGLRAPWMALFVQSHPGGEDQSRALANLRLAQELGAETHVAPGWQVARQTVEFARLHNVTRIVIGKPMRKRLADYLRPSPVDEIVRQSEEIDVHVIKGSPGRAPRTRPSLRPAGISWRDHALALGVVAGTTALCLAVFPYLALANLIMLYLLGVMVTAVRLSRAATVTASAASVLAFDFFFVPPRFTFSVSDAAYVVTFVVMFVAALVISGLASRLRAQAESAARLERQAQALSALTRELAGARGAQNLMRAVLSHLSAVFECRGFALLPGASGRLEQAVVTPERDTLGDRELGVAQWVFENGKPAGATTQTLAEAEGLFVPLAGTNGPLGVLGLLPRDGEARERLALPDRQRLLDAFARQAGLALEVDRLEEEAKANMVEAEREKLRAAILSTVTHDFRTPLAAIAGSAESLLSLGEGADPGVRRSLLENIFEESARLGRLVDNLLRMAALESGTVTANLEPTPLEEVAGSALSRVGGLLAGHRVRVDIPADLPHPPMDGVLMEQVFVNLLENAAKYAPPGSEVALSAARVAGGVEIRVCDDGPGLPPGDPERLFERFRRGDRQGPGGHGLGLSICRAIVKIHGGAIRAENRKPRGACFVVTLKAP
ncbi:sensor histidine kinase [Desulfolutivibrio sulfoxidireducens]|uniref:sensor histidine kinase n=1 Tax=Desulfolutivibrio sulfoxidireducens TaxID=2773299 RepID=UPI00159D1C08|nr:sensor histidine kinase KdpD [Desulfolutivibrio sulfoxidireducens]QLA17253.1 DUF4118 domain-containing protein [Desulfolutivibrio sulfoxidireducens]QLA20820.1 DUF4118 domain-containing protein [Desulfolutivibrio sulfoxidireducens]